MKLCTKCKVEKGLDEFDRRSGSKAKYYRSWCRACSRQFTKEYQAKPGIAAAQSRKWREENPDRSKELNRKSAKKTHTKLRMQLINAYGGKCTCCGESDPHFLTIEHKEKKPEHHKGIGGTKLLYLIREEGYPDCYTVMCWNCNCARGMYGFCPHQPHTEEQRRYV